MRETNTTNPQLIQLIRTLKKQSNQNNAKIWRDVAAFLSKPSRQHIAVNMSGINRNTQKGDTIVVPGKILGSGDLDHALTVAAFSASEKAKSKLEVAKAKYLSIEELMAKNPSGSNIKIIR